MAGKGSRSIFVAGDRYRWKLAFNWQGSFEKQMSVAIELADSPGSRLVVYPIGVSMNYVDVNRGEPITPRTVETFIKMALESGWQPRYHGPTFFLGSSHL